jgi:hypothetical protein
MGQCELTHCLKYGKKEALFRAAILNAVQEVGVWMLPA